MQVEELGLKLNITVEQLKNLLRLGEVIEAQVVSKKGEFKYILRIKGKLFEATSNLPLNLNKVTLKVKSLNPQVVLKLIDYKETQKPTKIELNTQVIDELKKSVTFKNGGIKADIIEEKSNNEYTLRVGSKFIQIKTKKPIKSPFVKLILEKDSNDIKIIEEKTPTITFMETSSTITIDDTEKIIEELASKIEESIESNDRLKLIPNIVKLKNVIKNHRLKELLSKAENILIKKREIDKKLMKNIVKELKAYSSVKDKDLEKLATLIKESIKQFSSIHSNTNTQENLFILLPFMINNKEEKVLFKKENLPNQKGKKSFKITIILPSSKHGTIIINGLSIEETISVSLFFTNKFSFEKFKSREEDIKKLLGDINFYLGLADIKPVISSKNINIKI